MQPVMGRHGVFENLLSFLGCYYTNVGSGDTVAGEPALKERAV